MGTDVQPNLPTHLQLLTVLRRLRLVYLHPTSSVVGKCGGMVQRAGVNPHSPGLHLPRILNCPGKQSASQTTADKRGQKPKIYDLDVLPFVLQLVIAGRRTVMVSAE